MKNDVSQFGRTCDACQRRKSENMPYPCLLQPTPVLTQAWSHLTMDFIEQLPQSRGFDTRLVVVDRLTKFSHFIALTLLLLPNKWLSCSLKIFIDFMIYQKH